MFVTGNRYSRTYLEKTTQECRNSVTKSIQKMVKNRIKISALLNYHGYQNLDQNWVESFVNSVLKVFYISNKNLKTWHCQKSQASYPTAILEFTKWRAAMMLYIIANRKRRYCYVSRNINKIMIKENGKVQAQLNTAWSVTDNLVGFTIPQSNRTKILGKKNKGGIIN